MRSTVPKPAVAAALAVLMASMSGCLAAFQDSEPERLARPADVGHDPTTIGVSSIARHALSIQGFDGTELATTVYEPRSTDALPDGSAPTWPVVVFLHGWGLVKEEFEGVQGIAAANGAPTPPPEAPAVPDAGPVPVSTNHMQEFAQSGFIAVAYDARGFGQSGGQSTLAGPAEQADLAAVLDFVEATFPTSGRTGVVGVSYGAGQAWLAAVNDPRVDAIVPMSGWVDLYHALAPGNVPKAQWIQTLYTLGNTGSAGGLHPMVHQWLADAYTRTGMPALRAALDARSALDRIASDDTPAFVCQGLQDTLFQQADMMWQGSAAFTRTLLYTGGHGTESPACWAKALEWMQFFLAGFDTQVDAWPFLETPDASGGAPVRYSAAPVTLPATRFLVEPDLARAASPGLDFTVEQRGVANPFVEPTVVWDQLGQPFNAIPEQFRQDPAATFFRTDAYEQSSILLGASEVVLEFAEGTKAPFQVTATLYREDSFGKSLLLARGGAAVLDDDGLAAGNVTIRLDFTKADINPGDRLALKVAANDPSWAAPLFANYAVSFTGDSALRLPTYGA